MWAAKTIAAKMARLVVVMLLLSIFSTSNSLQMPVGDPLTAIEGLVSRVLGEKYVMQFIYEVIPTVNGHDVFEIDANTVEGKPVLRGNNGVSLASALNFYLKYSCGCSISWGRDGTGDQLNLPQPLPLDSIPKRMISPVKYRCGFSINFLVGVLHTASAETRD